MSFGHALVLWGGGIDIGAALVAFRHGPSTLAFSAAVCLAIGVAATVLVATGVAF